MSKEGRWCSYSRGLEELRFYLALLPISNLRFHESCSLFLPFFKKHITIRSHLIARNDQNGKLVVHSFFVPYAIICSLPGKNTVLRFQGKKEEANKEIIPLLKSSL